MYFVSLMKGWSYQQLKEVEVPRKFNAFNIENNKIHRWLQYKQGKEL
jgi:hypothetical protein